MPNPGQTLPTADEAFGTLFNTIQAPVFLHKLASYGIQPVSEEETATLFELAGQLRNIDINEKSAASRNRFATAASTLSDVINQTPVGRHKQAAAEELAIKQAAAIMMDDPEVYNAVLALQVAQSGSLAGNA